MEHFKAIVTRVHAAYIGLKTVLERISQHLVNQTLKSEQIYVEIRSVYVEKERLYRYQQYAFEKNFLRGRDAMEERTLTNVVLGFTEFAVLNAKRIRRLAAIPQTEVVSKRDLYKLIIDALKTRQELTYMAKRNITVLYKAFLRGKRIFNYKFEDIPRPHNDFIVPKVLLNYSMDHNQYIRKYAPKVSRDLSRVHNVLGMFLDEARTAFLNSTVNASRLNYTFERFLFSCRTFLYSKSIFYSQGIDLPLTVLINRYDTFQKTWEEINALSEEIRQNLRSLVDGLAETTVLINSVIKNLTEKILKYVNLKNESLMTLADLYLSNATQLAVSTMKDFFREIETRGHGIYDSLTMTMGPLKKLWAAVLQDDDMKEYYNFTNNTRFLQNFTEVYRRYTDEQAQVRDNLDVREAVLNEDLEFFAAVDDLIKYLRTFQNSIKIDSTFIR